MGDQFFHDVFAGYRQSTGAAPIETADIPVPASDRIVNLDHNQAAAVEKPLDEFIKDLEADNGIPDEPGLKDLLLGQVRAGRELLRVGTFRAYLLYHTLIKGLGELAQRYRGKGLGIAAEELIKLIVEHVFDSF